MRLKKEILHPWYQAKELVVKPLGLHKEVKSSEVIIFTKMLQCAESLRWEGKHIRVSLPSTTEIEIFVLVKTTRAALSYFYCTVPAKLINKLLCLSLFVLKALIYFENDTAMNWHYNYKIKVKGMLFCFEQIYEFLSNIGTVTNTLNMLLKQNEFFLPIKTVSFLDDGFSCKKQRSTNPLHGV